MLAKSQEEWDRDESFMVKISDVILDKLGWIVDTSNGWQIKVHWA